MTKPGKLSSGCHAPDIVCTPSPLRARAMPRPNRLIPALLVLAAAPAAAEVPLDVVFDSELYIDGLFQFDKNIFDNDRFQFADDAEMRRAELVLRGKHSSGF